MKEITAALIEVQKNLPDVAKSETADVKNNEGRKLYSYNYAGLPAISAAILPLLTANDLAWVTAPGLNADGKFVLGYKLLHISGEFLAGEYPLPNASTPQQQGSAITYARRYALCAVVGLVPEDDDDGQKASQATPPAQTVDLSGLTAALNPDQRKGLKGEWDEKFSFGPSVVPKEREVEARILIAGWSS